MTEPEKMFESFVDNLPEVLDDNDNLIVPAERRIIFVVTEKKCLKNGSLFLWKKILMTPL
jgi:hypothetical protein